MHKAFRVVGFVTVLSLAAFAAIAYDPPPDSIAQSGDPTRWYKAADTPERLYHTQMKEAGAALKTALDECRASAETNRRDCIAEARRIYQDDVEAAKSVRAGG